MKELIRKRIISSKPRGFSRFVLAILGILLIINAVQAQDVVTPMPLTPMPGEKPGWPLDGHLNQDDLPGEKFEDVFKWGELLFHAPFNRLDGIGANLAEDELNTIRFSRTPRADLPGYHSPALKRPDGPEAQNCGACHIIGSTTGSGNVFNETRDRFRTEDIGQFINRNPAHLFGSGALQLLAEQTTAELFAIRQKAITEAMATKSPVTESLINSNGISYGKITANPDGTIDTSEVDGVHPDLWVKPFHLKAEVPFLRFLSAASTHITIGLQGPEVNPNATTFDEDLDGVTNEFTVGDQTAMTLYMAGLARPVSKLELHKHVGGKYKLTKKQIYQIKKGEKIFKEVGCADCHTPKHIIKDPVFREPSRSLLHRFDVNAVPFFGGGDPLDYGYDYTNPVEFDMTKNPAIKCAKRSRKKFSALSYKGINWHPGKGAKYRSTCWRQFERDKNGNMIARTYGDQRQHDMGPLLAEAIDEFGDGPSTWRGKELWGVADTGPWLHDGRATTLPEAIWWHYGDAEEVRNNYFALPDKSQIALITFLESLVLYTPESE